MGPLRFHNIYEIATIFIFYINENPKNVFLFFVFKSNFKGPFFTYTHSHQLVEALRFFTIFIKLLLYSFSMEMKMIKMSFYFLYPKPNFRVHMDGGMSGGK